MSRQRVLAVAATVAALASVTVAGAMVTQSDSVRARPPHPGLRAQVMTAPVSEPQPPSPMAFDPALFQAAAGKPPAAPAVPRLPQVDLQGLSVAGIPRAALRAYASAAHLADREDATCHLHWWLLAGIGLVESDHARAGGSMAPSWNGIAKPGIFGPRLDGKGGFAAMPDTDHGLFDKDGQWDRAVGPMQFLPQTWRQWGGTSDGHPRNPQDIRAATLAAGRYLCAAAGSLSRAPEMATAVFSYNHSFDYVRLVLTVAARYAGLDPRSLGVNRLPHDKPAHKKRPAKRASPSPRSVAASHAPVTAPSPPDTAAPSSQPSPQPAATPTDTPSATETPTPTDTPTGP